MDIQKRDFGTTNDGVPVSLYVLRNGRGSTAAVTQWGARLTELHMPDRRGVRNSVVLGFDNLAQYLQPEPFFGTTVGRVANRIAGGEFTLDGVRYTLPKNDGSNTLHSGTRAWDKRVWQAKPIQRPEGAGVDFSLLSPDGDDGFPGAVRAIVRYTWTDDDALRIDYEATTDKPTPINLTNHTYFNLAGAGSGQILDHVVTLEADAYTPVGETLIPTGELKSVRGTPLDFTSPTAIGSRFGQVGIGYDHNFVIRRQGAGLALVARVHDPASGRTLEAHATQPGVQLYTGNYLDGTLRGIGGAYVKHGAFCLETQHFPDSIHHPEFPSTVLRPGEVYRQTTLYRFGVA